VTDHEPHDGQTPQSGTILRSPEGAIFLASVLGLFLELALIRWVSCEIRVFAYCKNLVLVACFLGFGAGCLLSRRRADLSRAMFLLLLLTLLVRLPWQLLESYGPRRVTGILAELSGMMVFRHLEVDHLPWGAFPKLAFALFWTTVLFFAVALIMVPFGQVVGAGISRVASPLRAYSINVAGSLVGILAFTAVSTGGLHPVWWLAPVPLAAVAVAASRREGRWLVGASLALLLVMLPNDTAERREHWSGYQKLEVFDAKHVVVNNTGFQSMLWQEPTRPGASARLTRFNLPYAPRYPAGRVLIVGAGTGNDVAAAIGAGATSVIAVEIDRKIKEIGVALHPQRPYSDPRVEVVVDDARHYLKVCDRVFDSIVFSHLDSHTLLSSYTNVRLDNYIYTVEAFAEARRRLAPEGILYVSFFSELPFIGERLSRNLSEAFGHPPVTLETDRPDESHTTWRRIHFFTGEQEIMDRLRAAAHSLPGFNPADYRSTEIVASTDEWPFLPLENHRIPPIMLLISTVIIVLSVVFALKARPRGQTFDGRVFWLGAAFMLLEVHNVSRLALVFGTTWLVNAWVIGTILGLILVANALCIALARRDRRPGRWAVGGLFVSLAAAYLVPLELFMGTSRLLGGAGATLLLTVPIFFAALVFAEAFAASPAPDFALGWNILGAVVGGMAENLSYVWGIPALIPMAAVFYLAAILWPQRAAGQSA
jgi:spermidine synthase